MVKIIDIPISRQQTKYTCGVAVVKSILEYLGTTIAENRLSKVLKANSEDGTDYNTIFNFLRKVLHCQKLDYLTINKIHKELDNNHPIIVLLQAWSKESNYKNDWKDGHYAIVIGYDDNNLYFMDPSLKKYSYIPTKEFLIRWHDKDKNKKLKNFGIIIHYEFDDKTHHGSFIKTK